MSVNLMDLIRKRHDGPAWIVIDEVGNGTGSNTRRHADAVAVGIWPSQGYEIHGYELKASRSDVQKELRDPSKADAVGKFCDYWWLAIEDEAIIDGLTIPPTWGILAPKSRVLRAIRKAPKRTDVTPINRAFFAALTRRVVSGWVPRAEHEAYKRDAEAEATKAIERSGKVRKDHAERELEDLQARVKIFEEASGVKITERWEGANIARAVQLVVKARELANPFGGDLDAVNIARNELRSLEHAIARHKRAADSIGFNRDKLAAFIDELEAEKRTPSTSDESPRLDHGEDPTLLESGA